MKSRWDVIVVGAGAAGAATAMLLARGGLRVFCVGPTQDDPSVQVLTRGGVLQLQRWGLLEEVVAAGTPAVRRTVWHYGDDSVGVSIKPSGGVQALYAPRCTVLDAVLLGAAERSGVVFDLGVAVKGVLRDPDGAVTGIVITDRGITRSVCAPLVVGADGRNSVVAHAVGAASVQNGRGSTLLYGYFSNLPTDGYEWSYRPGLMAGAIPTNGGLTCVFVARPSTSIPIDPVLDRSPITAVFEGLSRRSGLHPRIAAADRAEPIRDLPGSPAGYLRSAHGDGWALVGDAGHWLDPVSAHGMTAALRDAALLARAVLSAPPGQARQRALADYQTVRDRLSRPMLRATGEIVSCRWDLARIRVLLRTMSSALADEVEALGSFEPVP